MLQILKAEIEYFRVPLIIMVIPLIGFAIFASADMAFLRNSVFLSEKNFSKKRQKQKNKIL